MRRSREVFLGLLLLLALAAGASPAHGALRAVAPLHSPILGTPPPLDPAPGPAPCGICGLGVATCCGDAQDSSNIQDPSLRCSYPKCSSSFHLSCLREELVRTRSVACPSCRRDIRGAYRDALAALALRIIGTVPLAAIPTLASPVSMDALGLARKADLLRAFEGRAKIFRKPRLCRLLALLSNGGVSTDAEIYRGVQEMLLGTVYKHSPAFIFKLLLGPVHHLCIPRDVFNQFCVMGVLATADEKQFAKMARILMHGYRIERCEAAHLSLALFLQSQRFPAAPATFWNLLLYAIKLRNTCAIHLLLLYAANNGPAVDHSAVEMVLRNVAALVALGNPFEFLELCRLLENMGIVPENLVERVLGDHVRGLPQILRGSHPFVVFLANRALRVPRDELVGKISRGLERLDLLRDWADVHGRALQVCNLMRGIAEEDVADSPVYHMLDASRHRNILYEMLPPRMRRPEIEMGVLLDIVHNEPWDTPAAERCIVAMMGQASFGSAQFAALVEALIALPTEDLLLFALGSMLYAPSYRTIRIGNARPIRNRLVATGQTYRLLLLHAHLADFEGTVAASARSIGRDLRLVSPDTFAKIFPHLLQTARLQRAAPEALEPLPDVLKMASDCGVPEDVVKAFVELVNESH